METAEGMGLEDVQQLKALLEAYQQTGRRLGPVPDDLQALLDNYNKDQGRPVEQVEGQDVTPTPGFVVKTSNTNSGSKVFLNITSSPVIPEPGGWSSGTLPQHVVEALEKATSAQDLQGQQLEALRLPLSCSDPRVDVDKKGSPCLVLDLIVNPVVLEAASRLRHFKSFLVSLALDHAQGKGKGQLELDPRFKLPKMAYKGEEVLKQRVRKERKPLVTDIGDMFEEPSFPLLAAKPKQQQQQQQGLPQGSKQHSSTAAAAQEQPPAGAGSSSSSRAAGPSGQPQLTYQLTTSGKPVEVVQVAVQLPQQQLCSSSGSSSGGPGVQVSLQGMQLQVVAPGCQPLCVPLPFFVDAAAAAAELAVASGLLRVVLPYAPLAAYVAAVQQAAPVAYGSLPVDHSAYMELDE